MKKVPLTKGKHALVDDIDYEYLVQWKWCYSTGYAVRGMARHGRCKMILMHRVVAERMKLDVSQEIDHVNLDRLDNQRANLRAASKSQNMQNRGKGSNNTSGYKGVVKAGARWKAQIKVNNRNICLGVYDTTEQAAAAYDHWALIYFGERARPNSVDTPFIDRRGQYSRNTSGFRGVCWDKGRRKWEVRVRCQYIGRFINLRDAVVAANKALIRSFGPDAYQNEI